MVEALAVVAMIGWVLAWGFYCAFSLQRQATHDTEAIAMSEITHAVDRAFEAGREAERVAAGAPGVVFLTDHRHTKTDFIRPRGCQLN